MSQSNIKDFTKGNITSQLIRFAWPLFLSNLLQILYNMVDMIIVGQVHGKAGTSAVAVGGDVTMLLTFIAIGFSSAGQVLIAKYIGAGKKEVLGKFVGTLAGFLAISSAVISSIGMFFQDKLLILMNTPEEAYEGAVAYSTICMAGLVFIYGYNAVSAIMRGMGDSKHPFIFIGVAAGLNVLLDILLVPRLGVGGAALATVVSQVVSVILCTVFLVRNRDKFSLICSFRDFIVWNVEMLVSLLKLGIPMAIKMAAVQISKLFVNSYVNSYGVEVSAFAGIANKLASFSNLISNSMNAAGSTMVGQNIAAEKYDRVKGIILRLAVITLTVSSIVSLAFIMFPEAIVGLFTGDGAVLALARPFVPIAVLLFFSSAMRAMMNALINGSGNYKTNFATAILDGIVLRIGLSVLFGLVLDMKHFGFWLGDALAGYTPFFIGLVFYLSGAWKKKID